MCGGVLLEAPFGHAALVVAYDASADKDYVRYLAHRDPRSTVRIAAWQALLSSDPDTAVAEFIASGFGYAVRLSEQEKALDADFARRILETYPAEYAPAVHAAAQRAVDSRDDAERARFAHGGFEAAKRRDQRARQASGAQVKALRDSDRAYVRNLARNDPGAQVRVSASYATRVGATDDDVVEFFASGWALGARLDLEEYRRRTADADIRWRAEMVQLIAEAQNAEKAARQASGEIAKKARETAGRAWKTVGDHTGPARSQWSEAQQIAERQAESWAAVVAAASAAAGPNWGAILDPAKTNAAAWATERQDAAAQARYWDALLRQALDGESRMRGDA